jgi:sugar/nucleoside kinase (ribokinase family)
VILFAGLSTVDVVQRVREFPAHGTKARSESMELVAGGPATNAAITAAALGAQVTLVTAIGAHPLGAVIRDELARFNVRLLDLVPDRGEPPTVSAITVSTVDGGRTVVSHNAGDLDPPATAEALALAENADAVLIDGHLPAVAVAVAACARGPVVLDAGSWKPVTSKLLPLTAVCACSAEFDAVERMKPLLDKGCRAVVRTDGANPVRWWTPDREGEVRPPDVTAVDTLGAGDVWHGAFTHALASDRGATLDEAIDKAIDKANHVAAHRVSLVGARTWITA